jgi:hypothetical protein
MALYFGGTQKIANIFPTKGRDIRIMTVSSSRTSCEPVCLSLKLLTLSSQYILSLVRFLSQNLETYSFNYRVHVFNARNKLQLHKLSTTLTICQRAAYYDSTKIFSKLPDCIAESFLGKKNVLYQT